MKWYDDGKLEIEGGYKAGKKDGKWITYWLGSEKKWNEGTYIDDKKEGTWIEWNEKGRKISETEYKNDVKLNE